ncbi:MAG: DUF3047 domain-containing protein [Pseudomonadota bacterium]
MSRISSASMLIAVAFGAVLSSCAGDRSREDVQGRDTIQTPCDAPDIQSKVRTRRSLSNPLSRYRRTKWALGAEPFGPVSAPAISSAAAGAVDLLQLDGLESLSPLPSGWSHKVFGGATRYSLIDPGGVRAIQGVADGSSSILFRHTLIDATTHPFLRWTWRVDQAVENVVCDHLPGGDDKSARLFVTTRDLRGRTEWFELVWANHLAPGELSFVHGFPHFVVAGPETPLGTWVTYQVDLRSVFAQFWPNRTLAEITGVGFMVNTDQSGGNAVATLSRLTLGPVGDLP